MMAAATVLLLVVLIRQRQTVGSEPGSLDTGTQRDADVRLHSAAIIVVCIPLRGTNFAAGPMHTHQPPALPAPTHKCRHRVRQGTLQALSTRHGMAACRAQPAPVQASNVANSHDKTMRHRRHHQRWPTEVLLQMHCTFIAHSSGPALPGRAAGQQINTPTSWPGSQLPAPGLNTLLPRPAQSAPDRAQDGPLLRSTHTWPARQQAQQPQSSAKPLHRHCCTCSQAQGASTRHAL